MNRRLLKEFRLLLLPWSVAGLAALLPWCMYTYGGISSEALSFFSGLAAVFFFGSIALLAAMSFGVELQQHTFSLMLAQPVPRSRLWNEKLGVLVACVITVCLLQVPFLKLGRSYGAFDVLFGVIFVIAIISSSAYWTFAARSTIGGAVFTLACQFLIIALGGVLIEKLYPPDQVDKRLLSGWLILGGIFYSAFFLWRGWQKFARLELNDVALGQTSAPRFDTSAWAAWLLPLRCKPQGMLANLIRKEVRLHQPNFLIAAVFTLCWLLTAVLLYTDLIRLETAEALFGIITAFDIALVSVLAGCISLGEEKSLGLNAWHLTLPVSARIQWLVKCSVAFIIGLTACLLLPWLLAYLVSPRITVGLVYVFTAKAEQWQGILLLLAVVFALSFWCATMLTSTLRAAFGTILGVALLAGFAATAVWCAQQFGGLQTPLVKMLIVQLQLPPDFFAKSDILKGVIYFGALIVCVFALAQSYYQFGRGQPQNVSLAKRAGIFALLVFSVVFVAADFEKSALRRPVTDLQEHLGASLCSAVQSNPALLSGKAQVLQIKDVESSVSLSPELKRWLRNSSIRLTALPLPTISPGQSTSYRVREGKRRLFRMVQMDITFPDGRFYSSTLGCDVPAPY